jgi:hypothetical protein
MADWLAGVASPVELAVGPEVRASVLVGSMAMADRPV